MASKSTNFNLQRAVDDIMKLHMNIAYEAMYEVFPQVAKESVKKLKATSPRRKGKGGGEYARHWAWKREKSHRLKAYAVVYNRAPEYRITHLLEHGHARRGGGRDVDPSPKEGHIKPVEEWAVNEAFDRVVTYLERKYSQL